MKSLVLLISIVFNFNVMAQLDQFHAGTAIKKFGKIAAVEGMDQIPENTTFKVSFDVAKQADIGTVSRNLDSAARFINMHVATGIDAKNIELAMVIHGSAVRDMTQNSFYKVLEQNINNNDNLNLTLIKVLQDHGVKFYVCGQSAAYYGVKTADLVNGVKMSLSAMTAHAMLQQQGFSLNPF